jgi:hypothetical protein
MPKLYQNRNGGFYTKTLNSSRQVITQQIDDEGSDWLAASGYAVENDLGSAYWELHENGWLYTKGEVNGGGEVDDVPPNWIQHDALRSFPAPHHPLSSEPLTIPCDNEFAYVSRFLYAPNKSIYYTILYVENSSDAWLQLPLLIKHRGAIELRERGAEIGGEFTETGLQLIMERRWAYLDDERFP